MFGRVWLFPTTEIKDSCNKQVPHDPSMKRRRWENTKEKEVFVLINEHWVAINFHLNADRQR